ncbi:hypothetical protein [Streptacidiphilus sp. PAMC 29251]
MISDSLVYELVGEQVLLSLSMAAWMPLVSSLPSFGTTPYVEASWDGVI